MSTGERLGAAGVASFSGSSAKSCATGAGRSASLLLKCVCVVRSGGYDHSVKCGELLMIRRAPCPGQHHVLQHLILAHRLTLLCIH